MWSRQRVRDSSITIAGALIVVAGLAVLHANLPGPLRWTALQDVISAVFPDPRSIILGSALILLGATCFGWPEPRGEDTPEPEAEGSRSPRVAIPATISSMEWNRRFLVPAGIAVALYGGTIGLVLTGSTGYRTGLLFVAALLASAIAASQYYPAPAGLLSRCETLALLLVAAGACVLYLHDASAWFYTGIGDEYEFYEHARAIAEGFQPNIFSQAGAYGYHPEADSLFQAATMRVLGEQSLGWKASCALAAALPAFPLYLIGRLAYSRLAGALAVGIYLPAQLLLAYTHIGYNNLDALFPVTAAVALLLAARAYGAPLYLFLAGIAAGMGWYTFLSGRFAILLLGLSFLADRPRSFREGVRDVGIILIGFGLAVLPFLLVNGTSVISVLSGQSSLTGHPHQMSVSQLVAQNAVRSLFAFVYSTQVDNHYLVGALFDNLSALFLLLGLATLFTPAPRESRFILIWYGVLLAVTGLTFYAPSIPTTRTNIVLPAACVIAAIGAATLIGRICDLFPNLTPAHSARPTSPRLYTAAPWALAAVAIVGVVGLNLNTFYRVMPERLPASQFALEMEVILSHPEATVIIAPDLASHVFEDTLQIYGVQADRVIQAFGPPLGLSVEQALTRARGHPAIVVSGVDQPLSVPGNRVALWDPSHTRYLVLAMVQPRSG